MNKKIAIIDCDSFYCSVEELFNPSSIGKPVVVLSNNDGCVIARNKLAKDFGIKMGEPFYQKKEYMNNNDFCVYSSNYNLYGDISDRVMNTIKKFANIVEVYSIDECFVDLTHVPDDDLINQLFLIKNEVKRITGIPVSIGVGPNKTLAKLTSKIAKKQPMFNGVCSFWSLEDFRNKCYDIPVDDVWGIGRQWTKKLKSLHIETIGQFLNMNESSVRKLLTINGLKTLMELKGYYCYTLQTKPKSKKNITSSRSFGEDINDFEQLSEAMYTYLSNGVKKLINNDVAPNTVTIFISGNIHKNQNHQKSKIINLQKQTRDISEIWSQIYPHLKNLYDNNKSYKKCGISFNNLINDKVEQLNLFSENIPYIKPPNTIEKKWEMKQNFISKKYTTSWSDIPQCT